MIDINKIDKNDNMWKLQFTTRLELVGEALNNEDSLGNVTKGRSIRMTDEEVRNAISGNMLSHIFTKNLRALADTDELCDTCKLFSPMKNGKIKEVDETLSASGNRVKSCLIDDAVGFMNAGKGLNEKRTKALSFAWGIATKGVSDTVLYNRVDPTEKNSKTKDEQDVILDDNGNEIRDTTSEANTNKDQNTQMLFHRPVRSSEYAVITQINLSRICFDDEKQKYVFEDKTKVKERIKKILLAYRNTLLDIEGAMCSTNMPHLMGISGVLVEKTSAKDLMTKYSSLNEDYVETHCQISNGRKFDNIQEFVEIINDLLNDEYLDFLIERNMKYVKRVFGDK